MRTFKNSQISTNLQNHLPKIITALEECDNHQIIIQTWVHTGIHSLIEEGIVNHVQINETAVLNGDVVPEPQVEPINERARGRRPDKGQWGLMNAEQIKPIRNGLCQYGGSEMPDQELKND